jgi:hypothetical protein
MIKSMKNTVNGIRKKIFTDSITDIFKWIWSVLGFKNKCGEGK